TFIAEPRSTWRNLVPAAVEQNLLSTASLPSNALAGASLAAQAPDPGAGGFRARFVPGLGAAGGGVQPSLKDGGTSPAPVPHEEPDEEPIVKLSVAPPAIPGSRG